MTLAAQLAQILDKLSDLVVGPSQGMVTASSTTSETIIVPQGLIAQLPDGRLVRARYGLRVGITPRPVSVRMLYLAGSMPAARNFAPVPGGLVATWQASAHAALPVGLSATGTTSGAFGYSARAAALRVASCVESSELSDEDVFKCGAVGGVVLIVLDPETKPMSGGADVAGDGVLQFREATWKIRANISTQAPVAGRRIKAREVHDHLVAVLQGAAVGDDQLTIGTWRLVRRTKAADCWELSCASRIYSEGRALQPEAFDSLPAFTHLGGKVIVPGDGLQPAPFRMLLNIGTSRAFSRGFDSGFGSAFGNNAVAFDAGFDRGFG